MAARDDKYRAHAEGEMAPDYDLSKLATDQVDLWIYLQADAILAQIMADQAERLGFPLVLGGCTSSDMKEIPQAIFNNG
jgi:hypothetical protein